MIGVSILTRFELVEELINKSALSTLWFCLDMNPSSMMLNNEFKMKSKTHTIFTVSRFLFVFSTSKSDDFAETIRIIPAELENLTTWCGKNALKLNAKKSKALLIHSGACSAISYTDICHVRIGGESVP
ncbi:hypothetical protein WA026_012867 [Henosepilachna vigintioctopunctata]|uniref:Uncharacterized protein n=1 Tax=Henosepilachna vigintioctopunctata TaxID=420089 RepID=A0AAW1TK20_9CUCU